MTILFIVDKVDAQNKPFPSRNPRAEKRARVRRGSQEAADAVEKAH